MGTFMGNFRKIMSGRGINNGSAGIEKGTPAVMGYSIFYS